MELDVELILRVNYSDYNFCQIVYFYRIGGKEVIDILSFSFASHVPFSQMVTVSSPSGLLFLHIG